MHNTAAHLKKYQFGKIKKLNVDNQGQRQRLLDLGFLPNETIKCHAKISGIIAFEIKSSIFALRTEIANKIILEL